MKNVFVSRPTCIPKSQEDGLNKFLSLLSTLDLQPRTLGSTDYPQKSPLDEVIRILRECEGVIILGYSQIVATNGFIKGEAISNEIKLSTEWNHIEAALAYEMQLPLLVIHDVGICRGIFDRGTLNAFIYEADLNSVGWCLEPEISGSIKTWKNRLVGHVKTSVKSDSDPLAKKRLSLKNEFVQALNKTYYKKNEKSISDKFDYTGYNLNYGLQSPFSDFLREQINSGFRLKTTASRVRTRNDLLQDINSTFPEIYSKLMNLFNGVGANLDDINACFDE